MCRVGRRAIAAAAAAPAARGVTASATAAALRETDRRDGEQGDAERAQQVAARETAFVELAEQPLDHIVHRILTVGSRSRRRRGPRASAEIGTPARNRE